MSEQSVTSSATLPPAQKPYMVFDAGPLTCPGGVDGLFFDFNYGARVQVPAGKWRVKITDRDAFVTLYDAPAENALVTSTKKYYINFGIEVWLDDKLVLKHNMDLHGKKVLIKYPVGTLGDIIAWFPYAQAFKDKHGCEIYCAMAPEMAELFRPAYPGLNFIGPDERPDGLYASYYMGIFFPCDDRVHQPVDWRVVGLQKNIPYLLGLPPDELRPTILPGNPARTIAEPYVCIAAQASSQAKYWTNGPGWLEVVKYLKEWGYRVLCIDRETCHGTGRHWNTIPYGSEDFTGALPLTERVNLLQHADFFVGLPSGLSWLAWAIGRPVVMMSGFSLPLSEFYTPYRLINYHVCNGCWNDTRIEFVHSDFSWCPRHKGTDREFECSRFISADMVKSAIERLMRDYKLKPGRVAR